MGRTGIKKPPVILLVLLSKCCLKFKITSSANNLVVLVFKAWLRKTGKVNEGIYHEAFPAWFMKVAYSLVPHFFAPMTLDLLTTSTINRIKFTSSFVRDSLSQGYSQNVYFGSGYDTVYLEHARAGTSADATFFELELPDVMKCKRNLADQLGTMRCPIHFITGNLNVNSVHEQLVGSSFNKQIRTSYVEEATLPYIEPDRRLEIFKKVLSDAASGSSFSFLLTGAAIANGGQASPGKMFVPFYFNGGKKGAQSELNSMFGNSKYTINKYEVFEPPVTWESEPPNLASDFYGKEWEVILNGVKYHGTYFGGLTIYKE